jgi:hypothetical protein
MCYLAEEDEHDPLVPGVPDLITVLGHRHKVRVGIEGAAGRGVIIMLIAVFTSYCHLG